MTAFKPSLRNYKMRTSSSQRRRREKRAKEKMISLRLTISSRICRKKSASFILIWDSKIRLCKHWKKISQQLKTSEILAPLRAVKVLVRVRSNHFRLRFNSSSRRMQWVILLPSNRRQKSLTWSPKMNWSVMRQLARCLLVPVSSSLAKTCSA